MSAPAWWCDAYGPPPAEVEASSWPRCFLTPDAGDRACAGPVECSATMAVERRRVFDAIQRGAADGDPASVFLAESFTSPDELLGGRDALDDPST